MISEVPAVIQVQAVYSFKGKNNDELNFKKGDIITITQKEEGGWWEGTLDGKTGWFPSNYVKDISLTEVKFSAGIGDTVPELQVVNRNLILKDIIESEKNYITEIQGLMKSILTPLGNTDILTTDEYHHIIRNLPEILELHSALVKQLEDCYEKPSLEQRVGHVFLSMAEKMKTLHSDYCSHHPKAVCILESHKDSLGTFVESQGGRTPGLVHLTAGLSRSFRRLERYGGCLQELERHMEEFHPDRGDTQRSVFVYQNLASHCATVRRQKEQELEVLCGSVRSWEGEEPNRLGELLFMGPIKLTSPPSTEVKDRHLVLFSQCIVLLSVSQRLSAFVFERKIPLALVMLPNLEDSELSRLSFEILVSGTERMMVGCPSRDDRTRLLELLQKQMRSVAALVSASAAPYVSRPPFRLLTRYLTRLIKAGLLTRAILREILDGGKVERQRRLILGCTILDHPVPASSNDLSRYWRQCRVECTLLPVPIESSCPKTESAFVYKEITLGVPFFLHTWGQSSSTSSSSTSSSSSESTRSRRERLLRAGRSHSPCGGSLDRASCPSSDIPGFISRTQSLPPVDLCFSRTERETPADVGAEESADPVATVCTSLFSFDSGLADVGVATRSQSRNAEADPSPADGAVYCSTLYAHWWRKLKIPASDVLAECSPSHTGKKTERSRG